MINLEKWPLFLVVAAPFSFFFVVAAPKRKVVAERIDCGCLIDAVFTTLLYILIASGEGCLDKPLATLWKNYCQSSRADVSMRLSVCSSGLQVREIFIKKKTNDPMPGGLSLGALPRVADWLPLASERTALDPAIGVTLIGSHCSDGFFCLLQATTAEHGLTEYWAHRVTWCAAPPAYPRIFAWVYRHEGRRLKVSRSIRKLIFDSCVDLPLLHCFSRTQQELRCHAVLCATSRQARQLSGRLEQRLREALHDFRREKLNRQTARLSVAACLYEDYSNAIPKRKLLLAPGLNNYKYAALSLAC